MSVIRVVSGPVVGAIALAALASLPAHAHHSAANFDTRTEIVVEGVVTKYDWRNPHVYMALEVEKPDGTRVEQEVEAGASSVDRKSVV